MWNNEYVSKTLIFNIFSRLVIETLEKVEKDRRCFRLVGGVLVERQVGEVEPALVGNKEKVNVFGMRTYIK